MALVLDDRVKETSTTTGTGTLDLSGAVSGFQTFVAGIGDGNTTYYAIVNRDEAEWEVGLGTVTDASTDTLARTTVISSSNSDSATNFSAGTKDVFCTLPASKVANLDTNDNLTIGSGSAGVDYTLTFDGADSDGVLTWMEDEDLFKFTDAVNVGVDDTGYDVKLFGATAGSYWLWDESADGVVQIGTLTVGVDDAGHDVKFFGDTASRYWLWDTSADGVVQRGTLTVGVDDTGHDVKLFGASAGAYALWDESANLLDLRGATAAGPGHLKLTTGELTVVDGDKLGRIDFQAPLEADGSDSILVAASIYAESDDTFSATVNNTDLVFALGKSETAAEKFRFTADGEIGLGGANYGSDGQVLTSAGAGAAAAWESITAASVTSYTNSTDNRIITSVDSSTINGEANLTFTGSALTCIGTVTVGVDDTGHDVKYFGATSGRYWLWDESADGVVQIGTLTVGVDDAGHDVKFFGATASKYMEWDESADTLNVAGTIAIPAGGAITNAGTMAPDITSTGKAMVLGF